MVADVEELAYMKLALDEVLFAEISLALAINADELSARLYVVGTERWFSLSQGTL